MREKKRKTAGERRKGRRADKTGKREERTRMLIGLKLNPVHLSLTTSAPSPPAHPFARPFSGDSSGSVYYCGQKSGTVHVDLRGRFPSPFSTLVLATFIAANPIRGTAGPSFLRKRPFAPARGYELCVPSFIRASSDGGAF